MPREAKHTDFSSAHSTHSTEGRPRGSREVWHTNLSSAHKLRGTEGRPREPKEEHTSPLTYRAGWGAKTSAHKPRDTESGPREPSTQNPHNTEGELMGLRETPTSFRDTQGMVGKPRKDAQKLLPSKLMCAV